MKKKSGGLMSKILLILLFFAGICMMASFLMAFEETEWIEGTVEHTYMSGAANGTRAGGSIAEVPMCRVVWYDKDGEKVIYGMPNDKDYEVGDSYYFEVDVETNHYPKRSISEGVVGLIIGIILCVVSILIWRVKFGTKKRKTQKQSKQISKIEQQRREMYNPQIHLPVVKCSICNGEQVAGFKDKNTGQFMEVMLIQSQKDLEEFKERYGVEDIKKEY